MDKTDKLLKSMLPRPQNLAPVGTDLFLPNLSEIKKNKGADWTLGGVINVVGSNVGIGTTSPTSVLDIIGGTTGLSIKRSVASDSLLNIVYDGTSDSMRIASTYGTTGSYKPMTFFTSDSERMRITSAGNVGIGTTSPSTKLHIVGDVTWGDATRIGILSYGASVIAMGATSNHALTLYANGLEKMRIASGGNVGIGTINPSGILHISGSSTQALFNSGSMQLKDCSFNSPTLSLSGALYVSGGALYYIGSSGTITSIANA